MGLFLEMFPNKFSFFVPEDKWEYLCIKLGVNYINENNVLAS